jgi:hypothetical protein
VISDATHTELVDNTVYTILHAKVGAALGASTGTFKIKCNILQGAPATVTIDCAGYVF